MDHRPVSRLTSFLLLGAAFAAPPRVFAQTSASSPSGYGTDDLQIVTFSHLAFQTLNSTTTVFSTCCFGPSYRRPTAGAAGFLLPIDAGTLPNGALLEEIAFEVRDDDPADNGVLTGSLCRLWTRADGSMPSSDCPYAASTSSSGTPGDSVITLNPNLTVDYSTDADGDANADHVSYALLIQFGTGAAPNYGVLLRLYGARLLFRRQVTPAPSSATFADVPTSHPFFQFVEALSASGITAGCGTGIYCPDSPLTRGQMAVFLAKALGLHWPAPASP